MWYKNWVTIGGMLYLNWSLILCFACQLNLDYLHTVYIYIFWIDRIIIIMHYVQSMSLGTYSIETHYFPGPLPRLTSFLSIRVKLSGH